MGKITLVRSELLFPSPLFVFQIEDAENLNARLLEEITAMRASSPGVQKSNRSGWHSREDFFARVEAGCQLLRAHVIDAARQSISRLAEKFDFEANQLQGQGWFNVNPRGGFNRPHGHPGFTISGTYWVRVPPASSASSESGAFEFLDPRINGNSLIIEGAPTFQRSVMIQPKAGWLIVFPSYMEHWVYPNQQDEERVSMAFNFRVVPKPRQSDAPMGANTE
jgi:uncharacterized protein (TIGR02466 family)